MCEREDDDSKMLLYDECTQGFHLYCLLPQLHQIPTGDWFCPGCQQASQYEPKSIIEILDWGVTMYRSS